jgi:hypothetical protein
MTSLLLVDDEKPICIELQRPWKGSDIMSK